MRVTLLGTGTAIPSGDHFPAGVLIELGSDPTIKVVLDLGPGCLRRLAGAGVQPHELDVLGFSHLHTDHTADLAAFMFASRNPQLRRRKPLTLLAPPGLDRVYEGLKLAWGRWVEPRGWKLDWRDIDEGVWPIPGGTLMAKRVDHIEGALGFRVEDPEGRAVAYTGDSGPCEALIELAQGVDLLVIECSEVDGHGVPGHMTPSQVAWVAEHAAPARVVLTHLYPRARQEAAAEQVKRAWDGPVVKGSDLARWTL